MALVSLSSVTKTYTNGFQAVKDFNLDIKDGEVVATVVSTLAVRPEEG